MPVKPHLELQAMQFLENAMQTSHPSHQIVTEPPAARPHLKPTLQTKYRAALTPYLSDGVIKEISYKGVLKALHTSATESVIADTSSQQSPRHKTPWGQSQRTAPATRSPNYAESVVVRLLQGPQVLPTLHQCFS
jgi:hypothetical protein